MITTTNPLRIGLRQERVISPQCLIIFGASGDLTHRKLIPALFALFKQRRLPSEFAVLGCARRPFSWGCLPQREKSRLVGNSRHIQANRCRLGRRCRVHQGSGGIRDLRGLRLRPHLPERGCRRRWGRRQLRRRDRPYRAEARVQIRLIQTSL